MTSTYLDSFLAPLVPYLARSDVTDLYVNRPGEIWIETLDGAAERCACSDLTDAVLHRLARQIAATSAQGINREHPLLSASLPDGTRVQVILPPATRGSVAMAFRRQVSANLSLEEYAQSGAFDALAAGSTALGKQDVFERLGQGDALSYLRSAVNERRNIMVSGGTSSGKTTFLNALIREIPLTERLVLIEDTPELDLVHENSIGLLAARSHLSEASVTSEDLLVASLRLRPDRIILGELRGREAFTFLRTVNTGHPGSMTTIHADSPHRALEQLALLVLQSGARLRWDDVLHYARASIDVFVQLERRDGQRRVAEVMVKR